MVQSDGWHLDLGQARVVGDSLIGIEKAQGAQWRRAVALADIRNLEERRTSTAKSIGLAVGIVGAVLVGGLILIGLSLQGAAFLLAGLLLMPLAQVAGRQVTG